MEKLTVRIHNLETDEVIDREMTKEEFISHEEMRKELEARETSDNEKAAAKAALLERLGMTAEEAKLLLD
jgi:hypothetical protein